MVAPETGDLDFHHSDLGVIGLGIGDLEDRCTFLGQKL